jgi:hypothetical protein
MVGEVVEKNHQTDNLENSNYPYYDDDDRVMITLQNDDKEEYIFLQNMCIDS